ncbi:MAG: diguanylate cyclase domain-containing protein, partial [bacterium]
LVKKYKFTQIEREITVSIGIASMPDDNINSIDDILKIADDFLFEAKNSGRNRIIGSNKGEKIEITEDDDTDTD